MIMGFTGSRFGHANAQFLALQELLTRLKPTVLHHGSCRGCDEEVHHLAKRLFPSVIRHTHPADTGDWRAWLKDADVEHPVMKPLERNRVIVALSQVIIACPYRPTEQTFGGTWSTWRHSLKVGKETYLLLPDGKIEHVAARRVQGELFEGSAR